jgi:hypothetical protein
MMGDHSAAEALVVAFLVVLWLLFIVMLFQPSTWRSHAENARIAKARRAHAEAEFLERLNPLRGPVQRYTIGSNSLAGGVSGRLASEEFHGTWEQVTERAVQGSLCPGVAEVYVIGRDARRALVTWTWREGVRVDSAMGRSLDE